MVVIFHGIYMAGMERHIACIWGNCPLISMIQTVYQIHTVAMEVNTVPLPFGMITPNGAVNIAQQVLSIIMRLTLQQL